MLCPACGVDNIQGAEECESCLTPLTHLGPPKPATGMQKRLLSVRVSQLTPKKPITVSPRETVRRVIEIMNREQMGSVLIQEGESLLGIFTERDALLKLSEKPQEMMQALDRPVQDFMTAHPETIDATQSLAWAINKMSVGGYRHLPVIQDHKISGIISVRDILRHIWP